MDVFEPAGDLAKSRPVLLFAFGGSFIGGERRLTHDICRKFAKKGFVTAAIDYRLYDRPLPPIGAIPDSLAMIDVVVKSVSDYKAAIRFFRKDAAVNNRFKIDPNFIFSGGFSAGSIAALHAAYMDPGEVPDYMQTAIDENGGQEGNTDDPNDSNMGYSSEVQGVVNNFGALHRKEWIDATDPPVISIHGDQDRTVPYSHGNAVVVIIPVVTVDGSGVMHPRATSVGLKNELITVPGGGHGGFAQMWNDSMEQQTAHFLADILCGGLSAAQEQTKEVQVKTFPNPGSERMTVVLESNLSKYDIRIMNQMGQTVYIQKNQDSSQLELYKSEIGTGIFILTVDFQNRNVQPVRRKILFK